MKKDYTAPTMKVYATDRRDIITDSIMTASFGNDTNTYFAPEREAEVEDF